jgi:hypothetical protein
MMDLKFAFPAKRYSSKAKCPIPRCWIKVCDTIGEIVFKKNEKDLTELNISLNVTGGLFAVTIVTENRFTTKTVLLR